MKLGITFDLKIPGLSDPDMPDDFQEELDSPETIEAIAAVLRDRGHHVVKLGDGRELIEQLLADPPEGVFNIAEGEGVGRCREARVPAVLEMLSIPYTGSDPLTLAVTLDKDCAKRLVASADVAVPRGTVLLPRRNGEPATPFSVKDAVAGVWAKVASDVGLGGTACCFPVIVKPAWEGSSKGIRQCCVVDQSGDLFEVVEKVTGDHRQPALVEEFIEGEEVTVGVIGNDPPRVIGIMRVLSKEPTQRFIYSLEVKRDYQRRVVYECPPRLPDSVLATVRQAALASYRVLGCRDVARIDFRLRDGRPYFLEANPLPGVHPETSDLVILARQSGWSYSELIGTIFESAHQRWTGQTARNKV
jgi:D-alanine-D-alanine ligase